MSEIFVGKDKDYKNVNSITFEERKNDIENLEVLEELKRKKEKQSPYARWVQVNKDYYKAEDKLMAQSPIAYRIFKFLINNMDGYNSVVCSYKVIQEYFNISQVTVARAIKLLKEKKYIEIYKSGTSNIYAINKNIVWNSWGNNFKYAKFGANILLSESEQEKKDIKKIKHEKVKHINIKKE
ncbi:replication/maintenance protein RepL [Clostridium perfringens]|uniref:replication/maintenance protein RepL n=1 Tax=Clostridium perfringens TaxID=1502 RepID=UPI003755263D